MSASDRYELLTPMTHCFAYHMNWDYKTSISLDPWLKASVPMCFTVHVTAHYNESDEIK